MNRRLIHIAWLAVWLLALTPSALLGQTEKGAIVGTVTDASGAAVPGATVTITNPGTNVSQTLSTNAEGYYEAPFLTPGSYKVSAAAPGFSTGVNNNVVVSVGARVRTDLALQAGDISATVEVVNTAPLVQTENATIGQVINNKTITDLPSGDRNIYSFILLNSNVSQPPGGNAPAFRLESGGSFSVSGGRPSSVTFKVDGLSNTDPTFGTPTITPSLESVQEFQVQNNAYSAEYEGAGQVNVASKAGTQKFHGSLFEFLRNDRLQPRNPIAPLDKDGKPGRGKLRFNQFGGTIGGPLSLPKKYFGPLGYKGHDKTFFFFSYEGRRHSVVTPTATRVLTPAERAGDFSAALGGCLQSGGVNIPLFNPNGTPSGQCVRAGQIFDPNTTVANPAFNAAQGPTAFNPRFIRQPFADNRIPANRLSPVAQSLIAVQQAQPNFASGASNLLAPAGAVFDNNQYSVRIDHKFSERDNVYGRVGIQDNSQFNVGTLPYTTKNVVGDGRVFNSAWTRVFSPTIVNEFRLGYVRGVYGDSIDEIDPAQFGIRNTFFRTLPILTVVGNTPAYGGFGGSVLRTVQNTYQLSDNLSLVRGLHALKLGFKLDHNRFQNGGGTGSNGTAIFNGLYTKASDATQTSSNRENSAADFLLGLVQQSSLTTPSFANVRNTPWSLYAQDDWKAARRVTLNLGLRYEYHQPYREESLGGAIVDFQSGRLLVANQAVAALSNTPAVACCSGERVVAADRNDFAPRIGLAIQPFKNDSLVIRAGYGVFYSDSTQFFHWRQYEPRVGARFNTQIGDFQRPGATLADLFPSSAFAVGGGFTTTLGGAPATLVQPFLTTLSALGSYRTPYSQQWSLSLQREVLANMLLEVNYAGSNSKNLPTQWIFNQPPASPLAQSVTSADPAANFLLRRPYANFSQDSFIVTNILQGNYNALTVKVDKRFSQGYSLLSSYTWSKSIDQGSEVFALGSTFNILSDSRNINRDRGLSSFDAPHRWVTSGIVELPFGKGKAFVNRGGLVDKLIGGFRVSGAFALQSGFPFSPNARNRRANTGYALSTERGDLAGEPYFSEAEWKRRVSEWEAGRGGRLFLINPASISLDYAPGTFGNIARNFFRAPFARNLDFSIAKSTSFGETSRFELRVDVLGATNERLHRFDIAGRVFANNLLTNPNVGSIEERNQIFAPRIIQLGAKIIF